MCNTRESSRDDLSRFVVMGTGNGTSSPVADCESMPQANKYVSQMEDTYKQMGITLSITEVQTYPYD